MDGKTVLIVDDDAHLRRTLADRLRYEGYTVHTASTGEEVLAQIPTIRPSLIILDLLIPGIGGVDMLRQVAGPDGTCACPVLVLTARTYSSALLEGVRVDGFLAKPCDEAALLREIRAILKRRGRKSDASERRSARILLGENDASFADEICAALRCAGHTARVAPDGFKVVEWARAMAPDVILAKEALPGPSKETLFLLMEAMPSTRSIPMVIYDDNGPVGRFGHINALASGPRSEGCSRAGKVVAAVQQALAS